MSTKFNWTINQLDRNTADGFVTTAHYTVSAVDGNFAASTYGTVGFGQEEGETMVPFAELTPEQVTDWVKSQLGQAVVEDSLQSRINALKAPLQASGLPWSA